MRRSTFFYLSLLLFLVLGLWLVIHAGSRLSAPQDLSGLWTVESSSLHSFHSVGIEQSGRYFQISFDSAAPIDFQMAESIPAAPGANDPFEIRLKSVADDLDLRISRGHVHLDGRLSAGRGQGFSASRQQAADHHTEESSVRLQPLLKRLLDNPVALILVQVTLILALSRCVGLLFERFHQPQVVGEMIAGIMLGPSLLGWLLPSALCAIFPSDAASMAGLNILSQVGVIFFMFLIGLELDPKLIRNRGNAAIVISNASIMAPLALGSRTDSFPLPSAVQPADAIRLGGAVHGRVDEHHRLPGARADPHRAQSAQDRPSARSRLLCGDE